MSSDAVQELKTLIEEYQVLIRLEKHVEIPKLSSRICSQLVELYDYELQEEQRLDHETLQLLHSIVEHTSSLICEKSKQAAALAELLDFVRIRVGKGEPQVGQSGSNH